ncbi:MAG: diaminopimelate decarboxylase, partial [Limnobacter sp.]|nr:diaminopimelate decarboxylase [Limnobacter sp.]
QGRPMPTLSFEPGRSIVGNAGVLLTEVQYLKIQEGRHFAVVDAAMNDLMRPALYQAYHEVVPVQPYATGTQNTTPPRQQAVWDVVGPVCESGDWLAKQRPLALAQGDLLAVLSAGAYGQTMASNYNSRGRAAEILVDGQQATLVRRRETIQDQIQNELGL